MAAAESRGLFITLEGGEGAGKSTAARALGEHLRERGYGVCVTREPGGTSRGEMIEGILQHFEKGNPLTPLAELLLFEADRAQHVWEEIVSTLAADDLVVCDRLTDSSLAYQGYGRGLDLDFIAKLNDAATGGLKPHLTLLLDVPPEIGLARAGTPKDAIGLEAVEFHTRVRQGFLELAQAEPDRFVVIDATLPEAEVAALALGAVRMVAKRLGHHHHAL